MPRDEREVIESPKVQGIREERVYTFDFSKSGVGTIEGNPTITVYDNGTTLAAALSDTADDVTTDVCGITGSYSGLVATAPELKNLTAGRVYFVFASVPHDGGQVSELFCRVQAKV